MSHSTYSFVQDEGLMPIVEPDISLSGDYDLETAVEVRFFFRVRIRFITREIPWQAAGHDNIIAIEARVQMHHQ